MLIRQLPHTINVKKLTEQEVLLKGELPVGKLTRVLEAVYSAEGIVQIELAFRKDKQRIRVAEGKVSCSVNLLCQRCMNPLEHDLEVDFKLAFVYTEEQADQLPETYEPVMMEDDYVQLVDLIEDDLILGLPIVASHADEGCQPLKYQEDLPEVEEESIPNKENPFQVLESLKASKKDS